MLNLKKRKKRRPMKSIITRKIGHKHFKITKTLFKQAAALAKYKKISIFGLLSDYLTVAIVSASDSMAVILGREHWHKYCEDAWNEINTIEKSIPRIKKNEIQTKEEE